MPSGGETVRERDVIRHGLETCKEITTDTSHKLSLSPPTSLSSYDHHQAWKSGHKQECARLQSDMILERDREPAERAENRKRILKVRDRRGKQFCDQSNSCVSPSVCGRCLIQCVGDA